MGCGSSSHAVGVVPPLPNTQFINITGQAKEIEEVSESVQLEKAAINVTAEVSTGMRGDGW